MPEINRILDEGRKQSLIDELTADNEVVVTNLADIDFPRDMKVSNFDELKGELNKLGIVIGKVKPVVNVDAPVVNVPAQPPIDFEPLLNELAEHFANLKGSNPEDPVAVRMSDGDEWVDKLGEILDRQNLAFQGFNDNVKIRGTAKVEEQGGKGALTQETVSVDDTLEQYTPTGARHITLSNIGSKIIYIGDSNVTDTAYAFALYPRQGMEIGLIKAGYTFYHVCASGDTSTIGVAKYA